MIIYGHESAPYLPRKNQITTVKGEMEYCSTTVFPNHNYEQSLVVVGVYRPPDSKHPEYGAALEEILKSQKIEGKTTIIAGDFNINSWGKEFHEWTEREDLWILANPLVSTHRSGTTDDSMLLAVGDYIPDGVLPGEAETDKELEKAEFYPVYVTEDPIIADHMALILTLQTQRSTVEQNARKYNVQNMSSLEWEHRNEKILRKKNFRDLLKVTTGKREEMNPSGIYSALRGVIQNVFKDRFNKTQQKDNRKTTKSFITLNKLHPKIGEFQDIWGTTRHMGNYRGKSRETIGQHSWVHPR